MSAAGSTLVLAGERLETLELVLAGLLGDVRGYRLPDAVGEFVPTLRVGADLAERAIQAGELELRDPDTTPLARLAVEGHAPADEGDVWLSGSVIALRALEHGPARAFRLTPDTDLRGRSVMLFGGEVRPVDVLRAVKNAGRAQFDLVVEGGANSTVSSRLVAALVECAEVIDDARVFYLPAVGAEWAGGGDVTSSVLRALGADDLTDLRREEASDRGGAVILLTGLSGSGKSTVARALADHLRSRAAQRVVLLDGDHVRAELASELGFSAADRDRNLQRQAWVGARVAEAGGLAICAPIAPFAATRAAMRAKVEPGSPFIVVHVATPLEVAEKRDRKGLYAKARAGLIKDFTGIDSPYEVPLDADLRIDTSTVSVDECVAAIEAVLVGRGLISG